MRILFLTPYPHGEAPSQRFRFEQYLPLLKDSGMEYTLQSFLSPKTWKILYLPGHSLQKAAGIAAGFFRRLRMLLRLHRYSCVFIHREASPVGPPLFEWLIARVWRKPVIYDFDDAIWLPDTSDTNRLVSRLKVHGKVAAICRWSHTISCGNAYLADWAGRQSGAKIVINPTTIDTLHQHKQLQQHSKEVVIGWTGTHSTLKYLKELQPVLQTIALKNPEVSFCIISNQAPDFTLPRLRFIPWQKESEIEDLLYFHIGLMPLSADRWAEGKCGFKALQYMALGIPPVLSPVGVNRVIVQQGETGFLAGSRQQWLEYLQKLIKDAALRAAMGRKSRQTVTARFSVEANTPNFLDLFTPFRGNNTSRAAT